MPYKVYRRLNYWNGERLKALKISYSAGTQASSISPMHNQDYFLIDETVWNGGAGFLFVIADGMKSTNEYCHVARLGTESVYSKYYADTSDNRIVALKNAFEYANLKVCEECPDAGTACTAALFLGETLHIAHIGNSRAYRLRNKQLTQITQDHSLYHELVQRGLVTADDLPTFNSLITLVRYLGKPTSLEVDLFTESLEPRDTILLCTKGVNYLPDEQIAQVLEHNLAENATEILMKLVEETSPPYSPFDDATAIVISLE